ncbi:MAG: hypothetical protein CL912_28540 [Deltaproteobacteria bacterium]|nr:hypothetical protein [Deltaproteobacteria bacterium]
MRSIISDFRFESANQLSSSPRKINAKIELNHNQDTYIGTMQFTKLNKDRIVYISGALNIPTLDKNEYDSWSEWKRDLEAVGEEIVTPGMLEKEIGEIVKASLVSTAMEGNLIDLDPREVKITVCGMRRVEG